VQAGGRVLVLAHEKARDLPFEGELTRITRAELRGVHFDPAGPWRRLEPRRVAELVLERGCEACLVSLEGKPLEQDLVGLKAADSRQATVIGLTRQGLGEWLVCQIPFPESAKEWSKDLSALLCEVVDLLEGYPSPEA
jgi:sugar phosphate isomerase/epimerase